MLKLFKIKSKEERAKELLDNLVEELKKAGLEEDLIVKRLLELKVSEDYIKNHFKLNLKEVKQMPKEEYEEEVEDYDEEVEEEVEEDTEEVEEEKKEEVKEVKKEVKAKKKEQQEEEIKVSLDYVLQSLTKRIETLELAVYRIQNGLRTI